MSSITVGPASPARFDDVEHSLAGGGDGAGCQCQWWLMTARDFDATTKDERQHRLRDQVAATVAPVLLAHVGGEAVGFVRVGPRTSQPRLARTQAFAAGSEEPWDDPRVWAVSCFVVRREHRRAGVSTTLLDAAVDHARGNGARMIEGYPVDTTVGTHSANGLYTGTVSLFVSAGFRIVSRPKPARAVVALDLAH